MFPQAFQACSAFDKQGKLEASRNSLKFPHAKPASCDPRSVAFPKHLRGQLAEYLRKRRGSLSLKAFSKTSGISVSSLHRLEMADQNITIDSLETLLRKLRARMRDVFPD